MDRRHPPHRAPARWWISRARWSSSAAASTPADWDGASLLPVLAAPTRRCATSPISEYYAHNIASG
jgi:hypothetical protein